MQLRRPSRRTFLVTAIVAPLVIAAFVIAGLPRHAIDQGLDTVAVDIDRGWPLWHARESTSHSFFSGADDDFSPELGFIPEDELLFLADLDFYRSQRSTQWRSWAIAVNSLGGLAVVAALTLAVLQWRARRSGWLRPRLIDLFALSAVAAAVCAHVVPAMKHDEHLKQVIARKPAVRISSTGLIRLGDAVRGYPTTTPPGATWDWNAEAAKYSWLAKVGLIRQSIAAIGITGDDQTLELLDDPTVAAEVEYVVVVDRPITTELVDKLARLPRLQCLYLRSERWELGDAAWIDRFSSLRRLAIECIVERQVIEQGGKSVSLVRSVDGATMAGPVINLRGLGALSNVEELWLASSAHFSGDLPSELAGLPRLQRLRLNFGADVHAIEALGDCSELRAIEVRHAVAGADHSGLTKLTDLEHLRLPHVTDNDMRRLATLPQLKTLYVGDGTLTDAGLAHFRGHAALETLNLGRCQISDASIPVLQSLRGLKTLDLNHTAISGKTIAALAELPELERLVLDGTAITDSDLEQVSRYPKLILLSVAGCSVSDTACGPLYQARPQLAVTGLGGATAVRASADDKPAASDEPPPAKSDVPFRLPPPLP